MYPYWTEVAQGQRQHRIVLEQALGSPRRRTTYRRGSDTSGPFQEFAKNFARMCTRSSYSTL